MFGGLDGKALAFADGLCEPVVDAARSRVERCVRRVDEDRGAQGVDDKPFGGAFSGEAFDAAEDGRMVAEYEIGLFLLGFGEDVLSKIDGAQDALNGLSFAARDGFDEKADVIPVFGFVLRGDAFKRVKKCVERDGHGLGP